MSEPWTEVSARAWPSSACCSAGGGDLDERRPHRPRVRARAHAHPQARRHADRARAAPEAGILDHPAAARRGAHRREARARAPRVHARGPARHTRRRIRAGDQPHLLARVLGGSGHRPQRRLRTGPGRGRRGAALGEGHRGDRRRSRETPETGPLSLWSTRFSGCGCGSTTCWWAGAATASSRASVSWKERAGSGAGRAPAAARRPKRRRQRRTMRAIAWCPSAVKRSR